MCVCVPSPTKGVGDGGGKPQSIVEQKMQFLKRCRKVGGEGGEGKGDGEEGKGEREVQSCWRC